MAKIALDNVRVDIPIFNSQGRSLKKAVLGFATGGKIGLTEDGKTIITALDGISFEANQREKIGLLGHNGAGKSTLLRILGKVYIPTSGTALIDGTIGSLIDISLGIDLEATGLENIFLRGALLGIPKKRLVESLDEILEFTELGDFINMLILRVCICGWLSLFQLSYNQIFC